MGNPSKNSGASYHNSKKRAFEQFITSNKLAKSKESSNDIKKDKLRKELYDYMFSTMKDMNIKHVDKETLSRIEDKIETIIKETITHNIDEKKKKDVDSVLEEDFFFWRYEMPSFDEIALLDDDYEENIRFDTYEMPKR